METSISVSSTGLIMNCGFYAYLPFASDVLVVGKPSESFAVHWESKRTPVYYSGKSKLMNRVLKMSFQSS